MKVLRILRNIGLIILAILLIAVGIIYWKKDSLIRSAVQSAAERSGLDIQYSSASLSLFSTFPDVGISLDSLIIRPQDTSQATLSTINQITLGIQFWSLFSDEGYELNQVILDKPFLDLNCNNNGQCNYEILMQDTGEETSSEPSSSMKLSIENFTINQGQVLYTDSSQMMQVGIDQWNFNLAGSYAKDVLDAEVKQDNMLLSFFSNGMEYTDSLQITGEGKLQYHLDDSRLEMTKNEWSFNALRILLNGMFAMKDDHYEMDINFDLPSNELKPLLSLIPAFYDQNYEDLISEGAFELNGSLKGKLNTETDIYPALALNAGINNGRIKYPDLPEDIHDIDMTAKINKEEGNLDRTVINVPNLNMKMGNNSEITSSMNIQNPISNPRVKGNIMLNADLGNVQKFYPLESIKTLAGKLNADANFDLNMDQLRSAQYEEIALQGKATINGMEIKADNQPTISLQQLTASINGKGIKADIKQMNAGGSDIPSASLQTGPIGLFFQENTIFPVQVDISANTILIDEWMPAQQNEESKISSMSTPYDLSGYKVEFKSEIKELVYSIYTMKDIQANGTFNNGEVQLSSSSFQYENANFNVSGRIAQLEEYLNETGPFYADLKIKGGRFDLYQYMYGVDDVSINTESNTAQEYFYLSPDMHLDIDYSFQGIDYGKIILNNVSGSMKMKEGNVQIEPTNMEGMGGQINVEGTLKTKQGSSPVFDFNTALQSLQFSSTFSSIATLDKVAPLLGRLQGIYNARLSTAGSLDKELFPNIGKLDAQGFIATKDVSLQSYEPITRLDKALGTSFSSDFPVENTQNWFAIQDGTVIIEPFSIGLFDETWQVEGKHQIGGEMNYQFSGPIPVEVLKSTEPGRKLVGEAQRIFNQIPLTSDIQLEKVDVQVLLTGTRNNPQVKLSLASNFRDEVTARVKQKIQSGKEEVREEAKETLEEVKNTVKDAAKDKAKELITGQKDTSRNEPAIDSLKQKTDEKLEKAKEKLNKWNPFKNKKG